MGNRLIIAAAGSGKTTRLVEEALNTDKEERVLVTTFTRANEKEILRKFYDFRGYVPPNVVVQTWFSFLLEHGVRPFQGALTDRRITGVLQVNGKSGKRGDGPRGPIYWGEGDFGRYYFTPDGQVFTDKIAKLAFRCNQSSDGYVVKRVSAIFGKILIDEIQDMAGYDLELIRLLMASSSSVTMVGDPRQTTYSTHKPQKYPHYEGGRIAEFVVEKCTSTPCIVDAESLTVNYRCNQAICSVADQLFPEYPECRSGQDLMTGHDGIFLVRKKDIEWYLERFRPMQLRHSVAVATNPEYRSMNYGDSKGLSFDRVLLYPTSDICLWLKDRETRLQPRTRCKLYVALTRARYSVAIVADFPDHECVDGASWYDFA